MYRCSEPKEPNHDGITSITGGKEWMCLWGGRLMREGGCSVVAALQNEAGGR